MTPRNGWRDRLSEQGLAREPADQETYWNETAAYRFSAKEIDEIELATQNLHTMCMEAVDHVVKRDLFDQFQIPRAYASMAKRSWEAEEPFAYGRFDLSYDGKHPPKMLEYNADTPTTLPDAAVSQWYWLQDRIEDGSIPANADQFNSIHESLVDAWKRVRAQICDPQNPDEPLYLACAYEKERGIIQNEEDALNVEYMRDAAEQAGFKTKTIDVKEIGWNGLNLTDMDERPIRKLFKLCPWEAMWVGDFGEYVRLANVRYVEPAWKMILSNKVILPILWDLFPGHPNLLPAFTRQEDLVAYQKEKGLPQDYAVKPIFGREGSNVTLVKDGRTMDRTDGTYGVEGLIYQQLATLPDFGGHYPLIGSWVTGGMPTDPSLPSHPRGGKACGMGIREGGLITKNLSRFVPHYFL
jgi:glutathionylspermidine synthase